ncbi:ABC transporter permease subunit [Bacillus sp. JJ675]|uniref:ABC transporter permease subunit n=1 Tax=Bacillus sp. JJ675 TaxID=3122972 RepID=UPI002FFF33FE
MVDRGLLYKEWKQHQWLFLIVFAAIMLSEPLTILNGYLSYQGCLEDQKVFKDLQCEFIIEYPTGTFVQMFWVGGVILALSQLGFERSKGTLDFTLSLPYKRGTVFQTKFVFGASVLLSAQLLSYLLSYLMVTVLKPEVHNFHVLFIGAMFFSFMVYSLVMAAGTMTGNILGQLVVAFSASILPYLLIGLPISNIQVILRFFGMVDSGVFMDLDLLGYITPIIYLNHFGILDENRLVMFIPLIMGVLFYVIGYFCFLKQPVERNGHFFLWRQMERPIQILVILFGIFGFGLAASENIISYIIGMIIGSVVGFLLSYFLIFKKTRL